MKGLVFQIIKSDKKAQLRQNLIVTLALILVIPVYIGFKLDYERIAILFGGISLAIILFYFFHQKKTKLYRIIGEIVFKDDSVEINSIKYAIDSIKSISIIYKSYQGEPAKVPLLSNYSGDTNQVTIEFDNNKEISVTFLSISKYDFRLIDQILGFYRNRGVKTNLLRRRNHE